MKVYALILMQFREQDGESSEKNNKIKLVTGLPQAAQILSPNLRSLL